MGKGERRGRVQGFREQGRWGEGAVVSREMGGVERVRAGRMAGRGGGGGTAADQGRQPGGSRRGADRVRGEEERGQAGSVRGRREVWEMAGGMDGRGGRRRGRRRVGRGEGGRGREEQQRGRRIGEGEGISGEEEERRGGKGWKGRTSRGVAGRSAGESGRGTGEEGEQQQGGGDRQEGRQ